MDLIIPVSILFGIGFAAGFVARMLVARKRRGHPVVRTMSSMRASELYEDPIWGR
jgi:hypothetical protein